MFKNRLHFPLTPTVRRNMVGRLLDPSFHIQAWNAKRGWPSYIGLFIYLFALSVAKFESAIELDYSTYQIHIAY